MWWITQPSLAWSVTHHIICTCIHRAIFRWEVILQKATKVFVVELESLMYSETCQHVPDGRCAWQPLTVSSSKVPGGGWRGHVPAFISTVESFPSLVSHSKALSFCGAPGWSVFGAGSEPLIPFLQKLQPPLSPAWTSRKSLTHLQLLFLQKGSFLSIFPASHAIQENKKALLTSALFSSYTQALSWLPIKPLPTQRRRQLLHVHLGVQFSPPSLGSNICKKWLVRVYFCSLLRLFG